MLVFGGTFCAQRENFQKKNSFFTANPVPSFLLLCSPSTQYSLLIFKPVVASFLRNKCVKKNVLSKVSRANFLRFLIAFAFVVALFLYCIFLGSTKFFHFVEFKFKILLLLYLC